MKKRKVDEETNAGTWMISKKRYKINAWRDYIHHEIVISIKLDTDFNCPKFHLMPDWAEHICRYGALQHYFAERH